MMYVFFSDEDEHWVKQWFVRELRDDECLFKWSAIESKVRKEDIENLEKQRY